MIKISKKKKSYIKLCFLTNCKPPYILVSLILSAIRWYLSNIWCWNLYLISFANQNDHICLIWNKRMRDGKPYSFLSVIMIFDDDSGHHNNSSIIQLCIRTVKKKKVSYIYDRKKTYFSNLLLKRKRKKEKKNLWN